MKQSEKQKGWIKRHQGWSVLIGIMLLLIVIGLFSGSGKKEISSEQNFTLPKPSLQDVKNNSLSVSYDDLMRYNEQYKGKIVHYTGQVRQVTEDKNGDYLLRIATKKSSWGDSYYDNVILVGYKGDRLLEDDLVEVYGNSIGLITYEAVMGNSITIPAVSSLYIELVKKAGEEQTSNSIPSTPQITQTTTPTQTTSPQATNPAPAVEEQSDKAVIGEKNALAKALSYLEYTSFSYSGLVKQLEFEGFTHQEAVYGVDNCGADWNEQAALKARSYLDYSAFSREGLINQLEFEGFTKEQAEYGVQAVGY